jgi:CRP/FNR family transcriptional regulator, anaerobic regulatory protein
MLRQYLETITPLSEEEWDYFMQKLSIKHFKKNEIYVKEGDICDKLGFILKGACRVYLNLKGKDSTIYFGFENDFAAVHDSFILGIPSNCVCEFIENTELIEISRTDLFDILSSHPHLEKIARAFTEKRMQEVYEIQIMLKLESKERYTIILERYPHLVLRTKNKHLSSFLNITEQSLSRLKKEFINTDI